MEQIVRMQRAADLIGIPYSRLQAKLGVTDSTWYRWRHDERTPSPESQAKLNEVEDWLDRMIGAMGA